MKPQDEFVDSTHQYTTWTDCSCWHPHKTQPTATWTCQQTYLQNYSIILHSGTTIHQKAHLIEKHAVTLVDFQNY